MQNLQTLLTAYYTETEQNPGAETGIDLLSVFEQEIMKVKEEMLLAGIIFDGKTRDDTEKYITNKVLGEPLTINALMDDLSEKVQKVLQVENLEDILNGLNIKTQKLEGRILPPDILERRENVNDGKKHEKKEKVKFPKLSLFLSSLREMDIYTDDIIVRYGKVNKNEARNESYMAIEIPRLNKTVFLSNEYGEASFVFAGFISDEDLMDHGKQDFLQSPQFLSRIEFVEGKEEAWKVKMQEILKREVGEKNEKVDLDLLESVRGFFSYLGAEEWMGLITKEKQVLDKKIYERYNFRIYYLCTKLGLERNNGKAMNPIGSSEDMMRLGEQIFGKHRIFYEYRRKAEREKRFNKMIEEQRIKEIQDFLRKNGYTADGWLGLTQKEKQVLDQKLQKEYNFGIRSLCTKLGLKRGDGRKTNPIGSSEDMMELGAKIFEVHWVFDEERKKIKTGKNFDKMTVEEKIKEIQNFSGKNSYTVEGWMTLTIKEKRGLDQKLQKEYNFGIRSLCSKLRLERGDERRMNPMVSSEDMIILGAKIFGNHRAFDAERKKIEKGKSFDNMLEEEKIQEIQNFLGENDYIVEGWMGFTTKGKRELDKKTQKNYGFGIYALFIKLQVKKDDGRKMSPINSSEDMMELGAKIFGNHRVFDAERKKIEKGKSFGSMLEEEKIQEIRSFLGKNGYIVEGWMELTIKEKRKLDQRLGEEYNFGIRFLCIKLGLERGAGLSMAPINSSEDMMELGRIIFGSHKAFDAERKNIEKEKNFDNMIEEEKIKEIRSFLGKSGYTVDGWARLTTKEKKILEKKIQENYNFRLYALCTKLQIKRDDGRKMQPIHSSEDMKTLGEKIFNKKLS